MLETFLHINSDVLASQCILFCTDVARYKHVLVWDQDYGYTDRISIFPTDCNPWSSWSPCTMSCGEGTQYRQTKCKLDSGANMTYFEHRVCNVLDCPPGMEVQKFATFHVMINKVLRICLIICPRSNLPVMNDATVIKFLASPNIYSTEDFCKILISISAYRHVSNFT